MFLSFLLAKMTGMCVYGKGFGQCAGKLAQEYGAVFEQPDDFFVRVVARPVCDDVVHYADDPIGCDDDMVYFVRVYSDVFVVARGGGVGGPLSAENAHGFG